MVVRKDNFLLLAHKERSTSTTVAEKSGKVIFLTLSPLTHLHFATRDVRVKPFDGALEAYKSKYSILYKQFLVRPLFGCLSSHLCYLLAGSY